MPFEVACERLFAEAINGCQGHPLQAIPYDEYLLEPSSRLLRVLGNAGEDPDIFLSLVSLETAGRLGLGRCNHNE